jgi:hypothetical protein
LPADPSRLRFDERVLPIYKIVDTALDESQKYSEAEPDGPLRASESGTWACVAARQCLGRRELS